MTDLPAQVIYVSVDAVNILLFKEKIVAKALQTALFSRMDVILGLVLLPTAQALLIRVWLWDVKVQKNPCSRLVHSLVVIIYRLEEVPLTGY